MMGQSLCTSSSRHDNPQSKRLTHLLEVTIEAAQRLQPLVKAAYDTIQHDSSVKTTKHDASAFSIADGCVEFLLKKHFFKAERFEALVGEEEASDVNIAQAPYTVGELVIPAHLQSCVDKARVEMDQLAQKLNSFDYRDVTVFIDPIDGTKEFCSGKGEQSTTCVGFSVNGRSVAGLIFRHLGTAPTYAAGCEAESCFLANLDRSGSDQGSKCVLASASAGSFHVVVAKKLGLDVVEVGGAGNKILGLVEGKGCLYLQDRGVSRWDTCAGQAVLKAQGGALLKLAPLVKNGAKEEYTYRQSTQNLDFVPNLSQLTKYNLAKHQPESLVGKTASSVDQVLPYSNLCGLVAISRDLYPRFGQVQKVLVEAAAENSPVYT